MTKMYIDFEVYAEMRKTLLEKLNSLMKEERLSINELVDMATKLYDVTDKDGLMGDVEIFKQVRDRIEEERVVV